MRRAEAEYGDEPSHSSRRTRAGLMMACTRAASQRSISVGAAVVVCPMLRSSAAARALIPAGRAVESIDELTSVHLRGRGRNPGRPVIILGRPARCEHYTLLGPMGISTDDRGVLVTCQACG